MDSAQNVWSTPRMVEPLIASAKSKWLWISVSTVLSVPSAVQLEFGGGLHAVEQPAEAQRVVVGVQQPLVRRVALGRVATPELVPLRQLDLGVLGQPETQLGRVGQGLADAPDGRGETGLDLHRLTHCRSLSDSRRRRA